MIFFLITILNPVLSAEYTTTNIATSTNLGSEEAESLCRKDAKKYGSDKENKIKKINKGCLSYIKENAKDKLHALSEDGNLEVWALYNIIIIEEKDSRGKKLQRVISGEASQLNLIEAIAISPQMDFVAILNNRVSLKDLKEAQSNDTEHQLNIEREILTFNTSYNGNVSPYRMIRNEKINHGGTILYHKSEEEIVFVNSEKTAIYSYFKESDYRAQLDYLIPNIKGKIESSEETFRKIASVDFMNDSLLVLDDEQTKVYAIDLKRQEVQWVMDKEVLGIESAAAIKYSPQNKILSVTSKTGEIVEFDQSAPAANESEVQQN